MELISDNRMLSLENMPDTPHYTCFTDAVLKSWSSSSPFKAESDKEFSNKKEIFEDIDLTDSDTWYHIDPNDEPVQIENVTFVVEEDAHIKKLL